MSNESQQLRELADAMDEADRIERWIKENSPKNLDSLSLSLRWGWAASCVGYEDVRRRMERKVMEQWVIMLHEVFAEAHCNAEILREKIERGNA